MKGNGWTQAKTLYPTPKFVRGVPNPKVCEGCNKVYFLSGPFLQESLVDLLWNLGKQCRTRSDTTQCDSTVCLQNVPLKFE